MILVTGANGQLGQCFRQQYKQYDWGDAPFYFADSAELNIADEASVNAFFKRHAVRWCVNCAAYTAVDKAESDAETARLVNTTGPQLLAKACKRHSAGLIHFSTDYVYHGRGNTPWVETDAVSPKGVYARTKLSGERAAMKANSERTMIIRTSWVSAPHGQNFVRTMLRLGAERSELNVVYDQVGSPTYAPDLADAVLQLLWRAQQSPEEAARMSGIFHYANEGVTSWYDFARAIMEIANLPCEVRPIRSSQYPTPAQRPPYSVLDKAKFKQTFGAKIPHWRDSLQVCIRQLSSIG